MRFNLLILLIVPLLAHATPGYFEPWGKDTDLKVTDPQSVQVEKPKHSIAVHVADQIIWFHQNILSPVDGPRSHFRPSSSSYMMQSMHKHGFLMGFLMGCDRLMRENSDEWVYRKIETEGKIFKYDPIR
jgi:putative component of membrane protein insertase Oxa1/YidC/SpoIIIJ protein YidD